MCTVSFIPVKDSYYFTTNRDEKTSRRIALHPAAYNFNNQRLIYPKDTDAGGTWVAMKENGDSAVLLNGAFFCHKSNPPYRQSRGVVLLEIFSTKKPSETFQNICLENIEPFTIILFEEKKLFEFRWDGKEKYYKSLELKPQTWASPTLYDDLTLKKKEKLFASFHNQNLMPGITEILNFHRNADYKVFENENMQIKEEIYSTVSITSILINKDCCSMHYSDIKNDTQSKLNVKISQPLFTDNEKDY